MRPPRLLPTSGTRTSTPITCDVADGGAAPLIGPDDDGATVTPPGSVAAWQAVIDRDRYLARRGQGAVIVGRMGGDAIAPGARGVIRWLIDETEGNGALAVRVVLPVQAAGSVAAAKA